MVPSKIFFTKGVGRHKDYLHHEENRRARRNASCLFFPSHLARAETNPFENGFFLRLFSENFCSIYLLSGPVSLCENIFFVFFNTLMDSVIRLLGRIGVYRTAFHKLPVSQEGLKTLYPADMPVAIEHVSPTAVPQDVPVLAPVVPRPFLRHQLRSSRGIVSEAH